jgi:abhydrolase domain-containing protein 12
LQPNTHVFTVDYRGFGLSTGSPTEAGLIIDGTALVEYVLQVCDIPADRILIIGQSLGTAVSSAVALNFADPGSSLTPLEARRRNADGKVPPISFAGVVLVAPFSSLPSLMLTYRIGGLLPILLPLRPFPYLAGKLTSTMVDKWLSAERLSAYYQALSYQPGLLDSRQSDSGIQHSIGSLQLIHSRRDMDIPYHQTEMICRRMFGEGSEPGVYEGKEESERGPVKCIDGSHGATVLDIKAESKPRVRFEIVEYGGECLLCWSRMNALTYRD